MTFLCLVDRFITKVHRVHKPYIICCQVYLSEQSYVNIIANIFMKTVIIANYLKSSTFILRGLCLQLPELYRHILGLYRSSTGYIIPRIIPGLCRQSYGAFPV
jgi:hypothetical protein